MMKPGKLFGIGIVIQIVVVGLMLWAVVAGISYVHKYGLKNITTEIWEGTDSTVVDSTKTIK